MNKTKFFYFNDYRNYGYPKRFFLGYATQIIIKACDFMGFINGQKVEFYGEYFLQNGYSQSFSGKEKIDIDIEIIGTVSKIQPGHSGYILVYYNTNQNQTNNYINYKKLQRIKVR